MKLYALCDKEMLQNQAISIPQFIQKVKMHNGAIIQYRNKIPNFGEIEEDIRTIRKFWSGTLILNDYLEFLDLVDGFHVGQEDLQKYGTVEEIRKKIGRKILGLSTHNREEIEEANSFDLDYVGLGAYRTSSTKEVTNVLGDEVEKLAQLSKHPVAVIGGVRLSDRFRNIEYRVIGSGLL